MLKAKNLIPRIAAFVMVLIVISSSSFAQCPASLAEEGIKRFVDGLVEDIAKDELVASTAERIGMSAQELARESVLVSLEIKFAKQASAMFSKEDIDAYIRKIDEAVKTGDSIQTEAVHIELARIVYSLMHKDAKGAMTAGEIAEAVRKRIGAERIIVKAPVQETAPEKEAEAAPEEAAKGEAEIESTLQQLEQQGIRAKSPDETKETTALVPFQDIWANIAAQGMYLINILMPFSLARPANLMAQSVEELTRKETFSDLEKAVKEEYPDPSAGIRVQKITKDEQKLINAINPDTVSPDIQKGRTSYLAAAEAVDMEAKHTVNPAERLKGRIPNYIIERLKAGRTMSLHLGTAEEAIVQLKKEGYTDFRSLSKWVPQLWAATSKEGELTYFFADIIGQSRLNDLEMLLRLNRVPAKQTMIYDYKHDRAAEFQESLESIPEHEKPDIIIIGDQQALMDGYLREGYMANLRLSSLQEMLKEYLDKGLTVREALLNFFGVDSKWVQEYYSSKVLLKPMRSALNKYLSTVKAKKEMSAVMARITEEGRITDELMISFGVPEEKRREILSIRPEKTKEEFYKESVEPFAKELDQLFAENAEEYNKALGSDPYSVFRERAEAEKVNSVLQSIENVVQKYQMTNLLKGLLKPETYFNTFRNPLSTFYTFKVRTADGRAKNVMLTANPYGDLSGELTKAALEYSRKYPLEDIIFIGAGGAIFADADLQQIYFPEVIVEEGKEINVPNAIAQKYKEGILRLEATRAHFTKHASVDSLLEETEPALEEKQDKGVQTIEVEVSHIVKSYASFLQQAKDRLAEIATNNQAELMVSEIAKGREINRQYLEKIGITDPAAQNKIIDITRRVPRLSIVQHISDLPLVPGKTLLELGFAKSFELQKDKYVNLVLDHLGVKNVNTLDQIIENLKKEREAARPKNLVPIEADLGPGSFKVSAARDEKGIEWIIKEDVPLHTANAELIGQMIAKQAGLPVPENIFIEADPATGKAKVYSQRLPDVRTASREDLAKFQDPIYRQAYLAQMFIGNYDSPLARNYVVSKDESVLYAIDFGASADSRAKGNVKDNTAPHESFLPKFDFVTLLGYQPWKSHPAFSQATEQDFMDMAHKIASLTDKEITAIVQSAEVPAERRVYINTYEDKEKVKWSEEATALSEADMISYYKARRDGIKKLFLEEEGTYALLKKIKQIEGEINNRLNTGQTVDDKKLIEIGVTNKEYREYLLANIARFMPVKKPAAAISGGEVMAALGINEGPLVGQVISKINKAGLTKEDALAVLANAKGASEDQMIAKIEEEIAKQANLKKLIDEAGKKIAECD